MHTDLIELLKEDRDNLRKELEAYRNLLGTEREKVEALQDQLDKFKYDCWAKDQMIESLKNMVKKESPGHPFVQGVLRQSVDNSNKTKISRNPKKTFKIVVNRKDVKTKSVSPMRVN